MLVTLAMETTPKMINESVRDNKESLPTWEPSLGEVPRREGPPPPLALPFDDFSRTGGSESDKETVDSFQQSNEASSVNSAAESTSSSVDDNVPSPRAEFRALARRASSMTIGNIETKEMAAWVSVLDVMECPSSDEYDYDGDDDEARVKNRTSSPEAPRRAPSTSFRCTVAAIVG